MDPRDYPGNEETRRAFLSPRKKYAPIFRVLLSTKLIHKSEARETRLFRSKNTRARVIF